MVRAAISEELASSFPQVRVKVIYAGKAAEGPHPNVKSKGDRSLLAGRQRLHWLSSQKVAPFKSPRTQGR